MKSFRKKVSINFHEAIMVIKIGVQGEPLPGLRRPLGEPPEAR
jgi:hypothetical protein